MLTKDERKEVIDELSDYAAPPNSVGALIRTVFTVQDRAELGDLPLDLLTVTDQSTWLVDSCLVSRWRRTPSLMEQLLTGLVVRGKGPLQRLVTRVQQQIDPNPDLFKTLWVLAHQPFLSRPQLRNAARDLVENVDQPILRVYGPSKSGKTYTAELFNYVRERGRAELRVAPADLAEGAGPTYTVEDLAETLALPMKNTDPLPPRSASSYPRTLVRWLVRNMNRNPGLWIFVLDGFGQPNVQPEVIEFINQLAQLMFSPEYSRKMRLVLLHFEKDLIGNWRTWTVDDGPLALNGVSVNDVIDCLTAFNQLMQVENQPTRIIDPAEIPVLASAMLANAQTDPFLLPSLYNQLKKM